MDGNYLPYWVSHSTLNVQQSTTLPTLKKKKKTNILININTLKSERQALIRPSSRTAKDRLKDRCKFTQPYQTSTDDTRIVTSETFESATRLSGPSSHYLIAVVVLVGASAVGQIIPPYAFPIGPSATVPLPTALATARTTRDAPASTGYHRRRLAKSGTTTSSSQRCMSDRNCSGADDVQPAASR